MKKPAASAAGFSFNRFGFVLLNDLVIFQVRIGFRKFSQFRFVVDVWLGYFE